MPARSRVVDYFERPRGGRRPVDDYPGWLAHGASKVVRDYSAGPILSLQGSRRPRNRHEVAPQSSRRLSGTTTRLPQK